MGGMVIGGFEVLEKIGSGVMGDVYKARQVSMDRLVALKVLSPRFAKDRSYVEKFINEARSAGAIGHPNLIQVFDAGEQNGQYFFAMEYIDGPSILDLIETNGSVLPKTAAAYARDIAKALTAAEKAGVVHRDIKPANIMVTSHDVAKLLDLGLAKRATAAPGTASASVVGTPYYMPPEQGRGEEADTRSDIYALGATLYHMVTGKVPYTAPTPVGVIMAHATDPLIPPHRHNASVPRSLSAVIMKMMAKSPGERYQTAAELVEDLEAFLADRHPKAEKDFGGTTGKRKGVTTGKREAVPAEPVHTSRVKTIVGAAVGLILVIGMLGYVLTRPDEAAVVAQKKLDDAKRATGRDKEVALEFLAKEVEHRPSTEPIIAEAAKLLTEYRSAALLENAATLMSNARNARTVDEIIDWRRAMKDFQEKNLAGEFVSADAAREASDKIDAALKQLDEKEAELVVAERRKAEEDAKRAETERLTQILSSVRAQAKNGDYGDALGFLAQVKARFKTDAARAELARVEKELSGELASKAKDIEDRAKSALARAEYEKAAAAFKQLEKLGIDPYAATGKKGLADVAAAKKKAAEEEEAKTQQEIAEATNRIQASIAELAFDAALDEANMARKTLSGKAQGHLDGYTVALVRANKGMNTLVKGINDAQPKISVSRITPGIRGVFDAADTKSYHIKSSNLSVKHEWKAMDRKDLFKLADIVIPRSAEDRMNMACMAALVGEKEVAAEALDVAGKYDAAATKALAVELAKIVPELAPKAAGKEAPSTAEAPPAPAPASTPSPKIAGAPEGVVFWVGFEPEERLALSTFYNFALNPVTDGYPGFAQGLSVNREGNYRVGLRRVADPRTVTRDTSLCAVGRDSVMVLALRAPKPVRIFVEFSGGDPYYEVRYDLPGTAPGAWQFYAFRIGEARKGTIPQSALLTFLDIRSNEGPFEVDSIAVYPGGAPDVRLAEVKTWAETHTGAGSTRPTTAALSPAAQRDVDQLRNLIQQGRLQEALDLANTMSRKYAGTPDEAGLRQMVDNLLGGAGGPAAAGAQNDPELIALLDKAGLEITNGTWKLEKTKSKKNIISGSGAIVSKEDIGDFTMQFLTRLKSGTWYTIRWRWQGDLDAWRTYTRLGGGWKQWTASGSAAGLYLRILQTKADFCRMSTRFVFSDIQRDDLGGERITSKTPLRSSDWFQVIVRAIGDRQEGAIGPHTFGYTPADPSPPASGRIVIDTPADAEIELMDIILQK